ncbi:MAG TPA: maltose alpha-D-glucosyltransferase [Chthoniobacterales bacterium]
MSKNSATPPSGDPLWFKDAVIYETHVKAFHDANGDGIGDFLGITEKLDYLQNLGVTAIWLLPFYPSPLKDDGYDIADYTSVNPSYGTIEDFREFLEKAHERDLRVITELVLNHTSDQHAWFQAARRAAPGTPQREMYVWSDTPERYADARIIFQDFEASNWSWDPVARAYYWHRFYSHQPDLNFESPLVHERLFAVIDFWLGMGVDGLRLDAVPYLYEVEGTNCENLPETHAFLRKLRSHIDAKFTDRMLLAEANQWPEDAVAYFGRADDGSAAGDECHMCFHFPVMPRMFMALQMEDRFPIIDILDQTPAIPETCQWGLFLRNHDELTLEMVTDEERDYMYRVYATDPRARINLGIRRRLAPLLTNNRRRIELINILLLSLPGTPILYYGDEIGMGDNIFLGDRNGVRTPMQWSPDRNAGFSKANPQQLYLPVCIDPEYHYEAVNVDNQERNISSLLWWMRRVIAMRQRYKAFGRGQIEFLYPENAKVLALLRRYEDEVILVVVNLSRYSQVVELDLSTFAGYTPTELFSQNQFPSVKETPYLLTLGPHGHYWFELEKAEAVANMPAERATPAFAGRIDWHELLGVEGRRLLERDILPSYIANCRWFGGKARAVRQMSLRDIIRLDGESCEARILLIEVSYIDGNPETYVLPVAIASGEGARVIRQDYPQAVIAQFADDGVQAVLFDAIYDAQFRSVLLDLMVDQDAVRGQEGVLQGEVTRLLAEKVSAVDSMPSTILRAEQSNTSAVYGGEWFLKLYRRLEDGINPEVELTRFLTERAGFPNVPPFGGAIAYRRQGETAPRMLCMVQQLVQNQGDAWTLTLGVVGQYLEQVLTGQHTLPPLKLPPIGAGDADIAFPKEFLDALGTVYPERVRQLGQRTAEMHLALRCDRSDPAFAPETFSAHYQRSVYQSMRNGVRRTFQSLARRTKYLPDDVHREVEVMLGREREILERIARVLRRKIPAEKIRIHGDYHLGQVLDTGRDFVIIDFEGEPARPISERRLKRSALRDVAGMLRSFHYAAQTALAQQFSVRGVDVPAATPWVDLWVDAVSRAFLESYLATAGNATFLPRDRGDLAVLLEVYLLDKAVYEVGYELNNRPDWIRVPLRGIARILDS